MSIDKTRCCVLGCPSTPPLFKFPTTRALVTKWLAVLSPHCEPKLAPANASVCSLHFLAEEWESVRGRARLHRGAVPFVEDEDDRPLADTRNQSKIVPNDTNKDKHDSTKTQSNSETTDSENQETHCNIRDKNLTASENAEKKTPNDSDKDDIVKNKENDRNKDEIDTNNKRDTELKESDRLGKDKDVSNRIDSGEERVQESLSKEDENMDIGGDSKRKEKSKESTPQLPSGPRDIDKEKVEDIEDLLTYYHIKQNNIHNTVEPTEPTNGNEKTMENVEPVQIDLEPESDPVFIEISVDKDSTTPGGDRNDCLMVLESVQVDVDPSSLMLQDDAEQDREEMEIETLEIEEDPPNEKADPISLLTSSDEDDVIIQEPHIDTVEVSDETDEDDMPLVKLLKKRRSEKKRISKITSKSVKNKPTLGQIAAWGSYEYYCVQCHYKTSNAADYRKHMAAHAKVILMCQLCGYMTASSSQFAKHEKQHSDKTYKCDLCDFKAKRNITLVYHMKTHRRAKEYKCGECDFVAISDTSILKHIRYCSEGVKYRCDKCEYATKKRCDLKRHVSRKHADDEDKDGDYVPPVGCMD